MEEGRGGKERCRGGIGSGKWEVEVGFRYLFPAWGWDVKELMVVNGYIYRINIQSGSGGEDLNGDG